MAGDPDAFTAFERAGWGARAGAYEDFFGPIVARLAEPILDAAGVRAASRVLDVGTGPGDVAAAAAARGAFVTGIDLAPAMVGLAARRHPQLDFREGNAEALPFADRSFDAVTANLVLLHVARPEQVVAEAARVLRPGGRAALTVWDAPERARLQGVLLDAVDEVGAAPPASLPAAPPMFRFADETAFAELLSVAGLDDVAVRTVSFAYRVASLGELWQGLLGATVRAAALVTGQPPEVQRRIRDAFERIAAPYDGRIPVSVKVASGRQAASG